MGKIQYRSLWHGDVLVTQRIMIADIAAKHADAHGLTIADLKGSARARPLAHIRQDAMAECYATGSWSLLQIGRFFGGRDHTTVLYSIRQSAARRQLVLEAA